MQIPKTVAIIMDGNGRWATSRGLPRTAGHKKGVDVVHDIALEASRLGIEKLILYSFSTENWKRPRKEVEFLCRLPELFFSRFIGELMDNNIKVTFSGDLEAFPPATRRVIEKAVQKTENNTGLDLNLAINYGSRSEITAAMKKYADDVASGRRENDIDEKEVLSYLQQPEEIDLLIRTSGELRLSNFQLYQLAYAEMIFDPVLWPDFTEENLRRALEEFSHRSRRYGGLDQDADPEEN